MKYTEPKIFHIAQTMLDIAGADDWIEYLGVPHWSSDARSDVEWLIELAGRRCYKSFETEDVPVGQLNPNISKVRKSNEAYIGNILRVGHGSVIEHAYDTYAIEGVTRVFTHEIVRHRLCNFSQESLRFVRPTSLNAYFPDVFRNLPNEPIKESISDGQGNYWNPPQTIRGIVEEVFEATFEELESTQQNLVDILGMDEVKRAFGDKKKLQSAMRRLMPIGMSTGIVVTSNHRNWRHMIQMRTDRHAEEEIRKVFALIAADLQDRYPALYQDMESVSVGANLPYEYRFEHEKV